MRKTLRFAARNTRAITPLYNHINEFFYRYIRDRYPTVLTETQTIERIVSKKLSFSRYSDGEFKLCRGASIARQQADPQLCRQLREILRSEAPNFAVGIPPYPDKARITSPTMDSYFRKFYYREWESVHHMAEHGGKPTYLCAWAFWFNHYNLPPRETASCVSLIKRLWQDKDVTFVCNHRFRKHSLFASTFDNAKSHSFIHAPDKDAYSQYDDILEQAYAFPLNNLFLLACGPTATVLAHDLAAKGYHAVDTGDLLKRLSDTSLHNHLI